MAKNIKSADEVIEMIVKTLQITDEKCLADLANSLLDERVEYLGDSMFNVISLADQYR